MYNNCPEASWHFSFKCNQAMAPHSSTLAWKVPWTEEPGGLQSMGSLRVGQDSATSLSRIGEGNGNPLQCSCLENPRGGGAWLAAVYGVAQSRTRLKWLSSSNSSSSSDILKHVIFWKYVVQIHDDWMQNYLQYEGVWLICLVVLKISWRPSHSLSN